MASQNSVPPAQNGNNAWLVRVIWVSIFLVATYIFVRACQLQSYIIIEEINNSPHVFRNPLRVQNLLSLVTLLQIYVVCIFFLVAIMIFIRRSRDWVAILISLTLITYPLTEVQFTATVEDSSRQWFWVFNSLQAIGEILSLVIFFVFPDGRFIPRWSRVIAGCYTVLVTVWLIIPSLPYNVVHGSTFDRTIGVSLLIALLWHSTSVIALIYRYRYFSDISMRQQTKWVVFGLLIGFFTSTFRYIVSAIIDEWPIYSGLFLREFHDVYLRPVQSLILSLVPICFAIAIFRYRLWAIDTIINRTLVYLSLTLGVIVAYIGSVSFLSKVLQASNTPFVSLVGTGVVAVLFQPMRAWLQRRVNRLLYGDRDEPWTLISRLSRNLEEASTPDHQLFGIVETISTALRLPYVAVTIDSQENTFPDISNYLNKKEIGLGQPTGNVTHFPMIYQGETVGQLKVSPREGEGSLNGKEQQILQDIAHQAGVITHSVKLLADLQIAREKLVNTREEERRRLYRDLHDEIGAQLATQILNLTTIKRKLRGQLDDVDERLSLAIEHTHGTVHDLRRVIDHLRPPALDHLGLILALEEKIHAIESVDMTIKFNAPIVLPLLPASVEKACYLIVSEAISNVIKHASASYCSVEIDATADRLNFAISDNGKGMPDKLRRGSGLNSMRERAEEIGGHFSVVASGIGTKIYGYLPIIQQSPANYCPFAGKVAK